VALKRTPIERLDGAELVRRISEETEGLPPTRTPPRNQEPKASPASAPATAPLSPSASAPPLPQTATEQINFRGSPSMARLLAKLAAEQGSIRLVIARLLASAGHEVAEVDMAPPPGRRRLG
jgi:hypothetical protein